MENATQIRQFVVQKLIEMNNGDETIRSKLNGNFMDTGILDSLGFLDLLEHTELHYGIELSFEGHDPKEFTSLEGFIGFVERGLKVRGLKK